MCEYSRVKSEPRILAKGRFLTLLDDNGWEYVTRAGITGIAVIVAITQEPVTQEEKLVLVEQYRPAVRKRVIELPAGLVGDVVGRQAESMLDAAARELEEETGYRAGDMQPLFEGPIAVGVSDEVVSFFLARGLTRVGEGGGDETEDITVHEVPLAELKAFLAAGAAAGLGVDLKIYAGLFVAGVALPPG
jgi:ADP-ribose pyrophosphatase